MKKIVQIYIRGNLRHDLFYDDDDFTYAWNRLLLSAKATNVKILQAIILSNHIHIECIADNIPNFVHHFRMSISYKCNKKYGTHGMWGCRRYGKDELIDPSSDTGTDVRDLACYIGRNPLRHCILDNFWGYRWSTIGCPFGLRDWGKCYTSDTAPREMLYNYLPFPHRLPDGWLINEDAMIVPSPDVFAFDEVESLFGSALNYIEQMSHTTFREDRAASADEQCSEVDESRVGRRPSRERAKRKLSVNDNVIIEFAYKETGVAIPSMEASLALSTAVKAKMAFPKCSYRQLSRIFAVPFSSIRNALLCTLS